MEISTFEEDLLGLESFANKLEEFINVEHRYVSDSLVISLNAKFGSGKSTFLKMWKNRLESISEPETKLQVVEVNAWNDDYCGDPLVSLICALIEAFQKNDKDAAPLIEAAKDIGWILTGIGNQVVNKFTGVNIVAAGELAEKKKSDRVGELDVSTSFFSVYISSVRLRSCISPKIKISKTRWGQTSINGILGSFITDLTT